MKLGFTLLAVLALSGGAATKTVAAAEVPRLMALTFDDPPYAAVSYGDTISRAQRVNDAILAVLDKYQAPATAFVNEGKLHVADEVDERIALLQQWIDAGAMLGNHTFSHVDLNKASIEEFKAEIVRGEIVMKRLMWPQEPYQLYFRHPYTHTGDSGEKKVEIERFLDERGYKVAPHTIDSEDFIFNVTYVYSKREGDDATAERICDAYVDFVVKATEFAEDISIEIFGREIPQTLVLHANDINADCLDDLLRRFSERHYRFVSLDAVMSDLAYQTADKFVTSYGPTWLWRWMKSQEINISFRGDPEPRGWIVDRFQRYMQSDQGSQ